MPTATKICRVCGKEYEYCHTNRTVAGIFRWQDVACCQKHGSIYLARILESRKKEPVNDFAATENNNDISDFSDSIEYEEDIEDEDDELFEEDFEDEDEETE